MVDAQSQAERTELPSEIGAAKQLADVACQFEKEWTGRMPESVTAALVDDSLVITVPFVLEHNGGKPMSL